jgi:DNA-directed RNA polymerase specialized sigma24 family protein
VKLDYWNFYAKYGHSEEDVRANPDKLASKEEDEKSEELIAALEVIDRGGEKILTKRQKKAFQLVVREGKSYDEAAKRMKCAKNNVVEAVSQAGVKIRKLCCTTLPSSPYMCRGDTKR